jgi:hypothetical protein
MQRSAIFVGDDGMKQHHRFIKPRKAHFHSKSQISKSLQLNNSNGSYRWVKYQMVTPFLFRATNKGFTDLNLKVPLNNFVRMLFFC